MKTNTLVHIFIVAVALICMTGSMLPAQDLRAPGETGVLRETAPTQPGDLKGTKPTGIIVMMSEKGLQVINPMAPADLGVGESVLTERVVPNGSTITDNADPRPFAGLVLFGWQF